MKRVKNKNDCEEEEGEEEEEEEEIEEAAVASKTETYPREYSSSPPHRHRRQLETCQ
jgi:hypothetical protein